MIQLDPRSESDEDNTEKTATTRDSRGLLRKRTLRLIRRNEDEKMTLTLGKITIQTVRKNNSDSNLSRNICAKFKSAQRNKIQVGRTSTQHSSPDNLIMTFSLHIRRTTNFNFSPLPRRNREKRPAKLQQQTTKLSRDRYFFLHEHSLCQRILPSK